MARKPLINDEAMARLQIISDGFQGRILVLNLGANSLGRTTDNHFQIEHPSISARHCEITVTAESVWLHDCDSTNGTYIDGHRVQKTPLVPGQILRLGTIECVVEDTFVAVSIPVIPVDIPAPPRVMDNGQVSCSEHDSVQATHRCPKCRILLCADCVKRIRRRGGKELLVCAHCSTPAQRLGPEQKRKRSLIEFFKTIRLPSVSRNRSRR